MATAEVLWAGRSPFTVRHGSLARCHPAELLGAVLTGVLERSGTDPGAVDELLVGCATPVGAQAGNLAAAGARASGRLAGVAASVISTGDTSSLSALIRATDAVGSGRCGVVLVAGVESMSTVPAGADRAQRGFGRPLPVVAGEAPAPGPAAERWAERNGVDRGRLEAAADRSRRRAREAQQAGRPAAELLALPAAVGGAFVDDLPGGGASGEGLYSPGGLLTAATVAPMADGAAAAVVASAAAARRLGLEPVARVVAAATVGGECGSGAVPSPEAARRVLSSVGRPAGAVRRAEVGELFATSVVAWEMSRPELTGVMNPDGGSLALGHPQGATGLGLVARLVRALTAPGGAGCGLAACDALDGHGVAVLLEA